MEIDKKQSTTTKVFDTFQSKKKTIKLSGFFRSKRIALIMFAILFQNKVNGNKADGHSFPLLKLIDKMDALKMSEQTFRSKSVYQLCDQSIQ